RDWTSTATRLVAVPSTAPSLPRSSSVPTPNRATRLLRVSMSGELCPDSHPATSSRATTILSASSDWESPALFRQALMRCASVIRKSSPLLRARPEVTIRYGRHPVASGYRHPEPELGPLRVAEAL